MYKSKTGHTGGKKMPIIKSKKGQQLNSREVTLINSGEVDGLLVFDVKTTNNGVMLTYNTDGLICLSDFLRINEMTKKLFVVILRNIVITLKTIKEKHFSDRLIVWDIHGTYIHPSTWRTFLTYIPLQPYETEGGLKNLLQDIVSACNFVAGEDLDYVGELIRELNSGISYTAPMLEVYCDKISQQLLQENAQAQVCDRCPHCSAKLTAQDLLCPFCGAKIKSQGVNPPPKAAYASSAPLNPIDASPQVDSAKSSCVSAAALTVNEDEYGIVTVFRKSAPSAQTFLLKERQSEKTITISKFPFRIGKMQGVADFRICNNAISRKHADIIKENDVCFIVDLDSTNGTYLNDKKLQPGVKEALSDGCILRFADTEFTFHIN